MLDDQGTGGSGSGDGGGSADGAGNSGSGSNTNDETVPLAKYQHMQSDLGKAKDKLRSERERADAAEAKLREQEDQRLEDEGKHKERAEREKQRADSAEQKLTDAENRFKNSEKRRHLQPALKQAGLRDDAMNLLDHQDLSSIEVQVSETGQTTVQGLNEFVDQMKNSYAYAFQKPTADTINGSGGSSGGGGGSGEITAQKVFEAEKQWKAGKMTKDDFLKVYNQYHETQQKRQA